MTPNDTGTGAGGVDEDTVKLYVAFRTKVLETSFINREFTFWKEAMPVFQKLLQPPFLRLNSIYLQVPVYSQLEQVTGFAAKPGAAVEIASAVLQGAQQQGG